ncbi:hypothetical protein J7K44_01645 [bacterium]|nr:hypothetical protein [bacterium]
MIKEYHFGFITIDDESYDYDVEVRWIGEVLKWWRQESHIVDVGDIKRAVEENPEVIVIGTGESGMAKVTNEAKEEIISKGIRLIIEKTGQAVKSFNKEEEKKRKVIGLFHLTC